jgi:hypothetical protein
VGCHTVIVCLGSGDFVCQACCGTLLGSRACRGEGNETFDQLARIGSASGFVGPEPALGVSKWDLSSKIGRWLANQHQRRWRDLGHSQ